MKNFIYLIGFIAASSMISCKTTSVPPPPPPPPPPNDVLEVVEDEEEMEEPVLILDDAEVVVEDVIVEDVIVEDVIVEEAAGMGSAPPAEGEFVAEASISISEFVYYKIVTVDGKDKFEEHTVQGDGTFFKENGEDRLTIKVKDSDVKIKCKQMMHPKLQTDVFVEIESDIGDDTDDRIH